MPTPLTRIVFPSIYQVNNSYVQLPVRMAKCTPDTKAALLALAQEVKQEGGALRLSDLFRSYDMQYQAYLDYISKKKKAYSPPPGGSMHEGGRAFDLDLNALKIPLQKFWELAAKHGVTPIIEAPDRKASEAWHFDCRGSHTLVYQDYKKRAAQGKSTNFKPYTAMAVSSILSIGQPVDALSGKESAALIQSMLIRLGYEIGNIDGDIGPNTRKVLASLSLGNASADEVTTSLMEQLEARFPQEFFDQQDQQDNIWQPAPGKG